MESWTVKRHYKWWFLETPTCHLYVPLEGSVSQTETKSHTFSVVCTVPILGWEQRTWLHIKLHWALYLLIWAVAHYLTLMCLHNLILALSIFASVLSAQHWAQDRLDFPIAAKKDSSVLLFKNDGIGTSFQLSSRGGKSTLNSRRHREQKTPLWPIQR